MSSYVQESPLNVIETDADGTLTATITNLGDKDYVAEIDERLPAFVALAKKTGGWYAENLQGMSLETALEAAKMNYTVKMVETKVTDLDSDGTDIVDFPAYRSTIGVWPAPAEGGRAVKRGLGQVGQSYKIIQPSQVGELAAALMAQSDAQVVAAVTYGNPMGSRTCLAFKLPENLTIGGEDITERYLTLGNSYNTSTGLWGQFAPIRVACTNMQTYTFGNVANRFSFPHTGDVTKKVDDALLALNVAAEWSELWRREAEHLLTIKLSEHDLVAWLEKVLPTPKTISTRRGEDNWAAKRLQVKQIIRHAETCAFGRGTAYSAVQGLWEWADFYAPTQATGLSGEITRSARIVAGGELEKLKIRGARLLARR